MHLTKILIIFFVFWKFFYPECESENNNVNKLPRINGNLFKLSFKHVMFKKKVSKNHHNIVFLFLMLAGDVEVNPGPGSQKVSTH